LFNKRLSKAIIILFICTFETKFKRLHNTFLLVRKLKLIWDFHGPDADKIAQHHETHLKEYIKIEKLNLDITGYENISDMHSIAYMVVNENDMKPIRDALKPHRGQVYLAN